MFSIKKIIKQNEKPIEIQINTNGDMWVFFVGKQKEKIISVRKCSQFFLSVQAFSWIKSVCLFCFEHSISCTKSIKRIFCALLFVCVTIQNANKIILNGVRETFSIDFFSSVFVCAITRIKSVHKIADEPFSRYIVL